MTDLLNNVKWPEVNIIGQCLKYSPIYWLTWVHTLSTCGPKDIELVSIKPKHLYSFTHSIISLSKLIFGNLF